MLRLLRSLGVVLLLVAVTGCAVRFVPAYDATIEADINDLHKKVLAFLNKMQVAGRSDAGKYTSSAVKSFYTEATATTANLALRATIRDTGKQCPTETAAQLLFGAGGPLEAALSRVPATAQPGGPAPTATTPTAQQVACSAVNIVNMDATLRRMEAQHRANGRLALTRSWAKIFNTEVRAALFVEAQLKSAMP